MAPEAEQDALRSLCFADLEFAARYDGWTEVARGGNNTAVIRTASRVDGSEMALKIILNLTQDLRPLFARECTIARAISSPFVVRTYSPFTRASFSWLEMEFVEGTDLDKELERREQEKDPFPLDDALEIAHDVARGVAAAHAQGILHRDIKPANVLLPASRNPRAKLADFSIAKFRDAPRMTRTDLIRMTPIACSPELAAGQDPSLAHDVYGLGILFYLLFTTRQFPFASITPTSGSTALLQAHIKERPRPLRSQRPDLPRELDEIVAKSLSKNPTARPSAEDVANAIGTLKEKVAARAAAGSAPRVKPAEHRGLAALVLVGVLGIGGLIAASVASPGKPSESPSPTPEATVATPPRRLSQPRPRSPSAAAF